MPNKLPLNEKMIPKTVHLPPKMKKAIEQVAELGIVRDECEFIRWAIADKLLEILKYPVQYPYCKSQNIIPITKPTSSATFQCVDCSNTWDELFFRKQYRRRK